MLSESLKTTLADAFTFALKAQFYHWNIEGVDFVQYHDFTQELYTDVQTSVDTIAELIRSTDAYAPGTLTRFQSLTTIEETDIIPDAKTMLLNLKAENDKLLATLYRTYTDAEKETQLGVSNYIQDRIQAHEKHAWMLKAITK